MLPDFYKFVKTRVVPGHLWCASSHCGLSYIFIFTKSVSRKSKLALRKMRKL